MGEEREGRETQNSVGALKLWNCMPLCLAGCVWVCCGVCVCCAAAAAVERCNNISGAKQLICQMSALYHHIVRLGSCPLSLTRPHLLSAATVCNARQGRRQTPRGPTHWTGIFWKTHYALGDFRVCEREGNGYREQRERFLSVKFSKQCAIRAVMRFPQERERQTSLICIFSFCREKRERPERDRERGKEDMWEETARKTDWQSNLKLHP